MKRRTVLRYSVYAAGGAALVPSFYSCKPETHPTGFVPTFFDKKEYDLICAICDALLPETDTPGALTLEIPQFFDHMVGKVFQPSDHQRYKHDLNLLGRYLDQATGTGSFTSLSTEDQSALLGDLESKWNNMESSDTDEKAAYYALRGQAINYYLSTEYVGTELLSFLPIPGAYEPCISLEDVGGKAWAI